MSARVRQAQEVKFRTMRVLENELQFGEGGWAEADHLTNDELNRLRHFGFVVETTNGHKGAEPKGFHAPAPVQEAIEGVVPEEEGPIRPTTPRKKNA